MKLYLGWKRSIGLVESIIGNEVFNFDNQTMITNVRYPITGLETLLGLQEVENPKISSHSAHKDGNVVRPIHRPPLLPRRYPWYSFLLEA
jgi:hypothetical protein